MKKKIHKGLWLLVCGILTCVIALIARQTSQSGIIPLKMQGINWAMQSPVQPAEKSHMGNNERERASIKTFLQQMDSLKKDSTGVRLYDSICSVHPGLMDSARTAEAYYSLQHFIK